MNHLIAKERARRDQQNMGIEPPGTAPGDRRHGKRLPGNTAKRRRRKAEDEKESLLRVVEQNELIDVRNEADQGKVIEHGSGEKKRGQHDFGIG